MNLDSRAGLIERLIKNAAYRDAYVLEHIKNGIAFQIRTLRAQRGLTQAQLGELTKKPRNVISRLEDPNYGKFTLGTLLEVAAGLGVGLLVKFVPLSRLIREYEDVTPRGLAAHGINHEEERLALSTWAKGAEATRTQTTLVATASTTSTPTGAVAQNAIDIRGRLGRVPTDQNINHKSVRSTVSIPMEPAYWVLSTGQSQESKFSPATEVAA